MSLENDKNIIKKFNKDFENEKKFSEFIDNIINSEFDLYFEDILIDDNFILNINNGIKIQLTHLYNEEIFENNSLNSLLNKKNIEIEKNYKNYFNLLNEMYLNANKKRNKNNEKYFLINTFRKHCCKTEDICRHNCSNDSQFIICSLSINNNLNNNNNNNENIKIYLICNQCKKVYFSKYILAYCNDCENEYFTSILFTNKTTFPATWKNYHCEQIRNEKMKCLQCKEILYLNLKTHMLQCLNKNCLCEFEPLKIEWKCNICKTNFQSDAIVYNPLEIEIVKRIISQTLLLKHKAHPNRLPCCKLNIFFTDFYHKKDCNGVLYVGELKNKVIIVCEKCKAINFYDRFIWTCPKCGTRFRDKKGIKKEKNDKLLLKPMKNEEKKTNEEKNNFYLVNNNNNNKKEENNNNQRRINKSVNKENTQNNNLKRNENYILEQRKKSNLTEVEFLNMSAMNIHKYLNNNNENNENEKGRRKFSDKEKRNVVIKGIYSKDKNDKFIYNNSPQRRNSNLFNRNNKNNNINNNNNHIKLNENINNNDNKIVIHNNNSRNKNPKISSAKSLEKKMSIEDNKNENNKNVIINDNNDKEIIKKLMFDSPNNKNIKISDENRRFLEKIASTKNLLYDYKNFQTENNNENSLNKTKTLRHFKINSENPIGIFETERKKKLNNENKINTNENNNKNEENNKREKYREKINVQKRENNKQNNKEEENVNNRSMMHKRNVNENDLQNLDIKNVKEKDFDEKTMTLNRGRIRNRRERKELEEKERKEKERKEKEEKERLERRERREREEKERKEKEERERKEKEEKERKEREERRERRERERKEREERERKEKEERERKEKEEKERKERERKEKERKMKEEKERKEREERERKEREERERKEREERERKEKEEKERKEREEREKRRKERLEKERKEREEKERKEKEEKERIERELIEKEKEEKREKERRERRIQREKERKEREERRLKEKNENNTNVINIPFRRKRNLESNNNNNKENEKDEVEKEKEEIRKRILLNIKERENNSNKERNIKKNRSPQSNFFSPKETQRIENIFETKNENKNYLRINRKNEENINNKNQNSNKKSFNQNENENLNKEKINENSQNNSNKKNIKNSSSKKSINKNSHKENISKEIKNKSSFSSQKKKTSTSTDDAQTNNYFNNNNKSLQTHSKSSNTNEEDVNIYSCTDNEEKNIITMKNNSSDEESESEQIQAQKLIVDEEEKKAIHKRIRKILRLGKIPGFKIEEYSLIKQLGEGSYGAVYQVLNSQNRKKFAMKKIIGHNLDEIETFHREFEYVYSCIHRHIIQLIGVSIQFLDLMTYSLNVLMENALCDWETDIKNRFPKHLFYNEQELICILKQLVSALYFLQKEKNIAHRDLKPQNILIFKNFLIKLGDFGEAKEIKISQQLNTLRGTELFMSPILYGALKENVEDIHHNAFRSDVFSLGYCLIYAAELNFNIIYEIRNINNKDELSNVLYKKFKGRYSSDFIDLLVNMCEFEEEKRMDFISLYDYVKKIFGNLENEPEEFNEKYNKKKDYVEKK